MADIIYRYTTDYSNNAIEIIIKECNTHLCNNPRTCYEIIFEKRNKTIITVMFISEWYILRVPIIPQKWMDEFMKQKLDADLINFRSCSERD